MKLDKYTEEIINTLIKGSVLSKTDIHLILFISFILDSRDNNFLKCLVKTLTKKLGDKDDPLSKHLFYLFCELTILERIDFEIFISSFIISLKKPTSKEAFLFSVEDHKEYIYEIDSPVFQDKDRKKICSIICYYIKSLNEKVPILQDKLDMIEKKAEESLIAEGEKTTKHTTEIESIKEEIKLTQDIHHIFYPDEEVAQQESDYKKEDIDEFSNPPKWKDGEKDFYEDFSTVDSSISREKASKKGVNLKDLPKSFIKMSKKDACDRAALEFLKSGQSQIDKILDCIFTENIPIRNTPFIARFLAIIIIVGKSRQKDALNKRVDSLLEKELKSKNDNQKREYTLLLVSEMIKFDLLFLKTFVPHLWACINIRTKCTLSILHTILKELNTVFLNNKDTRKILANLLEQLGAHKKLFDLRSEEMIISENILIIFKSSKTSFKAIRRTVLEEYILNLVNSDDVFITTLEYRTSKIRSLSWSCPNNRRFLFKVFTKPWDIGGVSYKNMCYILKELSSYYPGFVTDVIDTILEELCYDTSNYSITKKSAFLLYSKYVSDLFCANLIPSNTVIITLLMVLSHIDNTIRVRAGLCILDNTVCRLNRDSSLSDYLDGVYSKFLEIEHETLPLDILHQMEDVLQKMKPGVFRITEEILSAKRGDIY
eukprot:GHVP01003834.1.p1 GENE.GHVP01003834.1~~GHVP01003834.1.p1  ORF type:complete len:728 (+),score=108.66 GHVP01003834.1:214-2184(+)